MYNKIAYCTINKNLINIMNRGIKKKKGDFVVAPGYEALKRACDKNQRVTLVLHEVHPKFETKKITGDVLPVQNGRKYSVGGIVISPKKVKELVLC